MFRDLYTNIKLPIKSIKFKKWEIISCPQNCTVLSPDCSMQVRTWVLTTKADLIRPIFRKWSYWNRSCDSQLPIRRRRVSKMLRYNAIPPKTTNFLVQWQNCQIDLENVHFSKEVLEYEAVFYTFLWWISKAFLFQNGSCICLWV